MTAKISQFSVPHPHLSNHPVMIQNFWARAAQVRCSCNCSLCTTTTRGLARQTRTTIPSSRSTRRPDAFVVFSSTIALSATVADSTRKEARSREWDQAIGEVRTRVEAVEVEHKRRLALLSNEGVTSNALHGKDSTGLGTHHAQTFDGEKVRTFIASRTWAEVFERAMKREEERATSGFQDYRGVPLELLRRLTPLQVAELIKKPSISDHLYGGIDCIHKEHGPAANTLSPRRISLQEWSIVKLVLRLLLMTSDNIRFARKDPKLELRREASPSERAQWTDNLRDAQEQINRMRDSWNSSSPSSGLESPQVLCFDGGKSGPEALKQLNIQLHAMFQEPEWDKRLFSFIKALCALLIQSRAPPDIQTYNVLLVGFCRKGQYDLVDAVQKSRNESFVTPNEMTHATMLRFFTATNNRYGFRRYLEKMRGLRSGWALDDPRKAVPVIAIRRNIVKAHMNQEVYTSLITGILHLFNRAEAMQFYFDMINEGWKPNVEIMTSILRDVSVRAKKARSMGWYPIKARWRDAQTIWFYIQILAVSLTRDIYENMLRICQYCDEEEEFKEVLQHGVTNGVLPNAILTFPNEMLMEDIVLLLKRAESPKQPQQMIEMPNDLWEKLRRLLQVEERHLIHLLEDNSPIVFPKAGNVELREIALKLYAHFVWVGKLREIHDRISKMLERLVEEITVFAEPLNHWMSLQKETILRRRDIDIVDISEVKARCETVEIPNITWENSLRNNLQEDLGNDLSDPSLHDTKTRPASLLPLA